MVNISYSKKFKHKISKIKDDQFREKVRKQIEKIKENPDVGKPMRHNRKGTRELYIQPYRISYGYLTQKNEVIILDFYHKDDQ